MSEKDFEKIDRELTNAVKTAEHQILMDKAHRNEVLVQWNSEKGKIEHIPARNFFSNNEEIN